jgi:hypothetical protein
MATSKQLRLAARSPPHASHCGAQSGVLGADWNKEKGLFEENPLTFCAVRLLLFVGHSVPHKAWLPLTVAAKQQAKPTSKQMQITTATQDSKAINTPTIQQPPTKIQQRNKQQLHCRITSGFSSDNLFFLIPIRAPQPRLSSAE